MVDMTDTIREVIVEIMVMIIVQEIVAVVLDMINAISDLGMKATGKIYHFIKN